MKKSILFVCMGNICRSPTAEGCMRNHLTNKKLTAEFKIDSAGTIAYHSGDSPDFRSQQEAEQNGVDISNQSARQVSQLDFTDFDFIIAMDRDNLSSLKKSKPNNSKAHLSLLTEWLPHTKHIDVPDPYYGGTDGFKIVFDLVNESTRVLLQKLISERFA